jgi:4-hydroxybenzoate polyprenyltransferase
VSDDALPAAARAPLLRRLVTYQAERFPLAAYVPMVAAAAFAAVAWSRAARGALGFVPAGRFVVGALTMLAVFLLLRIADEHKDAAVDRTARPELPVPRGLVTLAELRVVGGLVAGAVLLANALSAPALLWPLLLIGLWGALMTREFFAPAWLRARPTIYLLSHMVIMALVMLYGSGLDWVADAASAPPALWLFLLAAYLNGLVLEIGRKLKEPAAERPGVETYTVVWGAHRARRVWLVVLFAAAVCVAAAMVAAGASGVLAMLAVVVALVVAYPARALAAGHTGSGKKVEVVSGVWNLAAYLLLALPWVVR